MVEINKDIWIFGGFSGYGDDMNDKYSNYVWRLSLNPTCKSIFQAENDCPRPSWELMTPMNKKRSGFRPLVLENHDSYDVILGGAAMSRFGTPHEIYSISNSDYPDVTKSLSSETVSMFYDTIILDSCALGKDDIHFKMARINFGKVERF